MELREGERKTTSRPKKQRDHEGKNAKKKVDSKLVIIPGREKEVGNERKKKKHVGKIGIIFMKPGSIRRESSDLEFNEKEKKDTETVQKGNR